MSSAGSRLLDLLERSVLIQGIVTLALVGTVVYLAIVARPIPELLSQLSLLSLGFYFGSKVGIEAARARSIGKRT